MPRPFTVLFPLLLASPICLADSSCPALVAQIEAKIRANGVGDFTLATMDSAAETRGRVVGSCGQGSKKIVYLPTRSLTGPLPAAAASAGRSRPRESAADSDLLTECKDGSMSVGGQCKSP